ncbi:hypothetical protein Bca4012_000307 [Brassica carinata]
MLSMKETASNIAASAKSGMDKTKATLEEKAEKMTTRDPVQKQMATQKKEAKINQAEMQKREVPTHSTTGHVGHGTGTHKMSALPGQGTGQATGHIVEGTTLTEPIGTNTGTGRTAAHNAHVGGGTTGSFYINPHFNHKSSFSFSSTYFSSQARYNMDLFITWENDANHLVDDIEWIQIHGTCWAYSLRRHMNAACRIANLIDAESLSLAYLVNYMRMTSGLSDTLGLSSFDPVRPFLMLEGMVLDDDYRMLFAQFMRIPELPLPRGIRRFVVTDMIIHSLDHYQSNQDFEQAFVSAMNHSPITAAIPNYPSILSFIANPPQNNIYAPTLLELLFDDYPNLHVMFATGRGIYQGVPFVRFRDSSGLINGGFMNVEMGKGIIVKFVELIGACHYVIGAEMI